MFSHHVVTLFKSELDYYSLKLAANWLMGYMYKTNEFDECLTLFLIVINNTTQLVLAIKNRFILVFASSSKSAVSI